MHNLYGARQRIAECPRVKEIFSGFFSDWPKQPRAVQVMPSNPHQAVSANNKALTETATPRQLEAQLLLKAAATLQKVLDSWTDKPSGLKAFTSSERGRRKLNAEFSE